MLLTFIVTIIELSYLYKSILEKKGFAIIHYFTIYLVKKLDDKTEITFIKHNLKSIKVKMD